VTDWSAPARQSPAYATKSVTDQPELPELHDVSRVTSPAELEHEHVRAMGPDLGRRYHALWNDFVWLHMKWDEFETLYAQSADRVKLLNQVAPHFFWQLQDMMWRDVLLHVARIVDSPATGGRKNLTIQALAPFISNPALSSEVKQLVNDAVERAAFAKDRRNRSFAHNDLALKLKQAAHPLPSTRRTDVEGALEAIGRVLERIHTTYLHSSAIWGPVAIAGGGDALVAYLELAVRAEQQRPEGRRRILGPPDAARDLR
jgi:AbiU2